MFWRFWKSLARIKNIGNQYPRCRPPVSSCARSPTVWVEWTRRLVVPGVILSDDFSKLLIVFETNIIIKIVETMLVFVDNTINNAGVLDQRLAPTAVVLCRHWKRYLSKRCIELHHTHRHPQIVGRHLVQSWPVPAERCRGPVGSPPKAENFGDFRIQSRSPRANPTFPSSVFGPKIPKISRLRRAVKKKPRFISFGFISFFGFWKISGGDPARPKKKPPP